MNGPLRLKNYRYFLALLPQLPKFGDCAGDCGATVVFPSLSRA